MPGFPQLRVHSDHSLSLGASKMSALLKAAKGFGQPAMALANRGALYDILEFSEKAAKEGVQPVVGLDIELAMPEVATGTVVLLAMSEPGYINLCRLLKASYEPRLDARGKLCVPEQRRITIDELEAASDGIILLSGGGNHHAPGFLPDAARVSSEKLGVAFRELLRIMGDRLYIEICRNDVRHAGTAIERAVLEAAYGGHGDVLCSDGVTRAEAPLVATSDVWYATADGHAAWATLRALKLGEQVVIRGDELTDDDGVRYHLPGNDAFETMFADLPEALANTLEVAKRCHFRPHNRAPILPPFATEGGRSENDELDAQAHAGLELRLARIAGLTDERRTVYVQRLVYELGVIKQMGFPGYFLIVSDFIKWAKARDIPVGPGRGSGAGSVVAWSLLITNLDPLAYGLLFERFLNPDRVSMPDFDIDFCQTRRDEVIRYVQGRYGDDRVAMIVTYGAILAKTAVRDSARIVVDPDAGHVSHREVTELCSLMPSRPADAKKTLAQVYNEFDTVRRHVDGNKKAQALFKHAGRIEGLYRQSSTHAAGVIIGDRPLHELYPIVRDVDTGVPVCALSQKWAENAGAVKFDFLGLKNLSIIKLAVDYVKRFEGVTIDIDDIPLDDVRVYEAFSQGRTTGVFQMSSAGMRDSLRQIKPDRLGDITAINALYRPGPMAYIPSYAHRKAGEEAIVYPGDPELTRPILEETYGYMVYQEQVMQVAQVCAGYSLGAADLLRRAMGKKIAAEMAAQKTIFIHGDNKTPGAVKLGMSVAAATELFNDIEKFADYGFNKSHAAAYAVIAYQTMWLKVNHPAAFYAALLTYEGSAEGRGRIKDEMNREAGIELLMPDINRSVYEFTPEHIEGGGMAVRFGLAALAGVTDNPEVLATRGAKPFRDLADVHERIGKYFNKSALETLTGAGAFDCLEPCRARALSMLAWLNAKSDKKKVAAQTDMFGSAAVQYPADVTDVAEWGDRLAREFGAIGFYPTVHPIDEKAARLAKIGVKRRASYAAYMRATDTANLSHRGLCVLIDDVEMPTSKAGRPYLKVRVSEREDTYQVMVFQGRQFQPRAGSRVNPSELAIIDEDALGELYKFLLTMKKVREPVVVWGDLGYDGGEWGVSVKAWRFESADVLVASIQADLLVVLEPDANPARVAASIAGELEQQASAEPTDARITLLQGETRHTLPGFWRLTEFLDAGQLRSFAGVAGVTLDEPVLVSQPAAAPAEAELAVDEVELADAA